MGSIDPRPRRAQAPMPKPPAMQLVQPVPAPPRPAKSSMTGVGALGMVFGFILFGLGALVGGDLFMCGLGLAFIALGYSARPKRLCPACKLSVPLGATVCGHCRTGL